MEKEVREVLAKVHALTLEPMAQRSDLVELAQLRRDKLLAIRELVDELEGSESNG